MEALVVDPEMMGDLVQHGGAHLLLEVGDRQAEAQMRSLEDDDAVGQGHGVLEAAIVQRDTLVDAEDVLAVGVLFGRGVILDHDDHVVERFQHPLGELLECPVDEGFKSMAFHDAKPTSSVEPMNHHDVLRWVDAYEVAWETNDPDQIGALFTDDAQYRTRPYRDPIVGRDAIVAWWLQHRDEHGTWDFDDLVLGVSEDLGFVQAETVYAEPEMRTYHNLWVIRLDEAGRCREFTEWWMREPTPEVSG